MFAFAGQRGSGTILVFSVLALSVGCLALSQAAVASIIAQVRLNAAADSAALTADDALRGLITGYPCEIAKEIALDNMAILDECRIVGFEAFVKLHIQTMGIVLNASARAGPSN